MRRLLIIFGLGVAAAIVLCVVFVLGFSALGWILFHHDMPVLVDHLVQLTKPSVIDRLEITDKSHAVLWALENHTSSQIRTLDYGVVPDGYTQVFPAAGSPPPLKRGAWVLLSASTPEQNFVHVWSQAALRNKFYEGMTIHGRGCKTPRCDEQFRYWGAERTDEHTATADQGS